MISKLDKFLRYLETERGFSLGTIEAYRLDIAKGLIPFVHWRGKFEAGEVTRDDIKAYLDFLVTNKGNSAVTRARKLAAIKSFFNYLLESEEVRANPASAIKSPRVAETQPEYLTEEECIRLLRTITQRGRARFRKRDVAIVILLLHTGLRASELTNLKPTSIDLGSRQIKITRKGNKEQYLHLNGEAAKALADYLYSRPESQNGRLFVGNSGGNLTRTYVYEVVRRYLKLAGITKAKHGPHVLRHTFCTRLHQKGVPPFVIKELAGHKSLNTTMRYVNIENKEQAEAIDKLEFRIF